MCRYFFLCISQISFEGNENKAVIKSLYLNEFLKMLSKYVKKWTNNKPCFVNFRNIRQYDTVCVLINDEAEKIIILKEFTFYNILYFYILIVHKPNDIFY